MGSERIGLIAMFAFQIGLDRGSRHASLLHSDVQAERKDGIDETMRVPQAHPAPSSELIDLVGVILNGPDILDEVNLRDACLELRIQLVKLTDLKVAFAFFLR